MTRIKFMLLGEAGVGKSSLRMKFTTEKFSTTCESTIGAAFELKKLMIDDKEVAFHISDMAGNERYQSVWRQHYPMADAVLLVYDVTNPYTFFELPKFLRDLRNYNLQAEVLLVGNKNDDLTGKKVTVSMIEEFAAKENLDYIETSAKTGENIDEAFIYLAKKFLFSEGIISKKPDSLSSTTSSATLNNNSIPTTSTGQGSEQLKKKIPKEDDTIKLAEIKVTARKGNNGCNC